MTKKESISRVRIPVGATRSTVEAAIEYLVKKKMKAYRSQLRQSAGNGRLTVAIQDKQEVWDILNQTNKKP